MPDWELSVCGFSPTINVINNHNTLHQSCRSSRPFFAQRRKYRSSSGFYRTSYQGPRATISGNWLQKQLWVPPTSSIGPCWKLRAGVYEGGVVETEGDNERTSGSGKNDRATRLVSPGSNELLWRQTVVRRSIQRRRQRWWPSRSNRTRLWVSSARLLLHQYPTRQHCSEIRLGNTKGDSVRRNHLVYKSWSQEWFPTVWHEPGGLAFPSIL